MISFQEYIKRLGFDIDKYDVLDSISDFDLVGQLMLRNHYSNVIKGFTNEDVHCFIVYVLKEDVKNINSIKPDSVDFKKYIADKMSVAYDGILEHYRNCFDNPIISAGNEKDIYHNLERRDLYKGFVPNMMSYSDVVKPLSRISLENFIFANASLGAGIGRKLMLTQEEIEQMDENDNSLLFLLSNESVSKISAERMSALRNAEEFLYSMYLSVDIAKSDSEILDSLAKLLPVWREELNINEPEKKRSWSYIRDRILGYKIIPLIDLLELAKIYTNGTKRRVPKRVLSLIIYPNGERDGFGLEQTVIPFLEKIRAKTSKLLDEYKINKE